MCTGEVGKREKKYECILGKRGIGYIEITILNKAIQKTEIISTPWCLLRILPLQSLWSLCSYSKVMVQQVKKKETGLETVTTKMSTASLLLSAIQNACHPLTTTHPLGPWRSAFSKAHFSCHWTFYQEWVCGIVSEQSQRSINSKGTTYCTWHSADMIHTGLRQATHFLM